MQEILPIVSGLVLGAALGMLPSMRARVSAFIVLTVGFGVLATIASGEFRVSWAFLLIDIPLVAASAVAGFLLWQRLISNWVGHPW